MKNTIVKAIAVLSVFLLSACGGGGGGGGGSDAGSETPGGGPVTTTKKFSVNLANMDIRKISTGESIPVDVSGVTSGELTLSQ